jgi:hypothetical protein
MFDKMKEIRLTREKIALVDDEDYEFLNQFKWQSHFDGHNWYVVRTAYNPKRRIMMHRIIMNTPKGLETDHIDHNGLNCQKNNMRNCTHNDNIKNKKPSGRSKFLGVSYDKKNQIRANIKIKSIQKHLGYFKTEEEVAIAYDKKALEIHGEFANLNFPDPNYKNNAKLYKDLPQIL